MVRLLHISVPEKTKKRKRWPAACGQSERDCCRGRIPVILSPPRMSASLRADPFVSFFFLLPGGGRGALVVPIAPPPPHTDTHTSAASYRPRQESRLSPRTSSALTQCVWSGDVERVADALGALWVTVRPLRFAGTVRCVP